MELDLNSQVLFSFYIDGNAENRILEKIGLHIPQETESFQEFTKKIGNNEQALKEHLSKNH